MTALDRSGFDDVGDTRTPPQTEAALGLRLSERLSMVLHVETEEPAGADRIFTVTPAAAWALTDRSTLQIGARLDGYGGYRAGLSLGLWHRF